MRGATAAPGSIADSAAADAQSTPAVATAAYKRDTLPHRISVRELSRRLRREFHLMGPPKLFLGEVNFKRGGEGVPVPVVGTQDLLVVLTGLVPLRQQASSDIQALAGPPLRHHVHLPAH